MVVPEHHTKVGEASTKYQPKLSSHLCENGYCETYKEGMLGRSVCVWITPATLGNSVQTQDTKISWVRWQRPVVPAQGGREKALSKFKASFSDQPDRSKVKGRRERLSDRMNYEHMWESSTKTPTKSEQPVPHKTQQRIKTTPQREI